MIHILHDSWVVIVVAALVVGWAIRDYREARRHHGR